MWKIGAQNGAPEQQFYIDWKKFNFNFAQILRVFLAAGLQGLQKRLHLCMSKSAHESSCSIQSLKMRFWMIFKLTGLKNMDFSDFKGRPQGMVNFGGSNLGSKVPKILFSWTSEKIEKFSILSCMLKMHQFLHATPNSEMVLDSLLCSLIESICMLREYWFR